MKLHPRYAEAMEKVKPFSGHWIRFTHNGAVPGGCGARSVAYYVEGLIACDIMFGGYIKMILAPYPKSKHAITMDGLKFIELKPFIFHPEIFTPGFTKYSNDLHAKMARLTIPRKIEPPSRFWIKLTWLAKAAIVPVIWMIAISLAIGMAFLVESLLQGQTGIPLEQAQAHHEESN